MKMSKPILKETLMNIPQCLLCVELELFLVLLMFVFNDFLHCKPYGNIHCSQQGRFCWIKTGLDISVSLLYSLKQPRNRDFKAIISLGYGQKCEVK